MILGAELYVCMQSCKTFRSSSEHNSQSLHEPSSKCGKVGLSKLKMKLNHYFSKKEGMISGIDHHLLIFSYVSVQDRLCSVLT